MKIHVEVARSKKCSTKPAKIEEVVKSAILQDRKSMRSKIRDDHYWEEFNPAEFYQRYPEVERVGSMSIYVEGKKVENKDNGSLKINGAGGMEVKNSIVGTDTDDEDIEVHVYDLNYDDHEAEYMDDEEEHAASHNWILPSASFEGLWDSLMFDNDIQSRLLRYIDSALLFAKKGVDPNLVALNKVVLLYGEPGTGKTTLCRALAQKAMIRLSKRFLYGQFVEVNSHSLFSKWFSESGKLVQKMFDKVNDLVEDPKCLVFLLIDEVESLAQCRQTANAGNEPTDSIRAVNALLTQIDRIRKYPNVIILTTSNMVSSIDLAFVDRADLKIHIGTPPVEATYKILATSINELIRVGIIESSFQFPPDLSFTGDRKLSKDLIAEMEDVARLAHGLSGRTLRKIPFLAHSLHSISSNESVSTSITGFLSAMRNVIQNELSQRELLQSRTYNYELKNQQ